MTQTLHQFDPFTPVSSTRAGIVIYYAPIYMYPSIDSFIPKFHELTNQSIPQSINSQSFKCHSSFIILAVPCFPFHYLSRSNPLGPQCHPKFHPMFITMQICSQMLSLLFWILTLSPIPDLYTTLERTKKVKPNNFSVK